MLKFLLGLLAGIVFTILAILIIVFSAVRLREKPPVIAANSVLVLRLNGEIPERAPVEFPIAFLGPESRPTVANVWTLLRMAAADTRIKGVVLEPEGITEGWAKLEELRADVEQFRKSGKPVYAFLKTPGTREYYVASAADRIYMEPEDALMLKGLRAEMMYFKGTLDKIGVGVQIEHAGKYKDFGDMFTRTSMSPETKEVLNSVLDDLYGNLVARLGAGRRKSPEEMRALIDDGPFLSTQARDRGLVDALRFEDQVFGELESRLKTSGLKKVPVRKYMKITPGSLGLEGPQRIAWLVGQGEITRGSADDTGLGDQGLTANGFTRLLHQVANDSGIKGVVVRIDSPGGEVTASDELWREMNLLNKKKPVVISMSDVAASGGYYMAMTGDPIVAYPGTLTGSIGVVFGKPDLKGLYNKLGITKDSLTRGRFADIDSDYKPLGPAELAKVQQGIEASYKDFVAKVAAARKRPAAQIDQVAQGRVWLGSQARAQGLVDELGGIDRALALVKQKAGIPAGQNVTLVSYPPRRSILDVLLRRQTDDAVESGLESRLGPGAAQAWRELRSRAALKGGLLRLMPWALEVK